MVQTFPKFLGDDFLFPAQNVSSSSVQLYNVSHEIFHHFQCYYSLTITHIVFFEKFSTYVLAFQFINQVFKWF